MCFFGAVAHQSSMQELDLLNSQLDPRIAYTGGPKTFTWSNGLLQESPGNLLLYSNDVSNAVWSKTNVAATPNALTVRGVSFNKIEATTTSGLCYQIVLGAGSANGNALSFLIKKGSGANAMNRFTFRNDSTATNFLTFTIDLDTGTITHVVGSGVTSQHIGDGVWKVTVGNTASIGAGANLRIYIGFGSGTTFAVGDYSYIANLQLQKGTVATQYVATTSAVAYDWPLEYDPITLKPIGRSVWEQRTNLLTFSQAASGSTATLVSLADNAATAPDGTTTMVVQTNDGTSGQHYKQRILAWPSGAVHTYTVYIKKGTANYVHILLPGENAYAQFDLTTGALVNSSAGTATSFSAMLLHKTSPGIFRFSFTAGQSSGVARNLRLYFLSAAQNTAGPSETSSATGYWWGEQLEAGAFASPYIPTAGSQVTRVADDVSFALSSIRFNPAGMTVGATGRAADANVLDQVVVQIDAGSDAQRWLLYRKQAGPGAAGAVMRSAGNPGDASGPNISTGARYKMGAAFETDNLRISANGSVPGLDVSAGMPTGLTAGRLGRTAGGTARTNAPIERIAFYPCPLANSELQALTA